MSGTATVAPSLPPSIQTQVDRTIRDLRTPPETMFEDLFGRKESELMKMGRRALPVIVRFAGYASLGSVMSLINLYWGMASSIVQAQKEIKQQAKYWGFLWGIQYFMVETQRDGYWVRRRVNAQKAWLTISKGAAYRNQAKGAIEVNSATFKMQVKQGIEDAAKAFNDVFGEVEQVTAHKLLKKMPHAPTHERRQVYAEMARRIRRAAGLALYEHVMDKIPPAHVRAMLGY